MLGQGFRGVEERAEVTFDDLARRRLVDVEAAEQAQAPAMARRRQRIERHEDAVLADQGELEPGLALAGIGHEDGEAVLLVGEEAFEERPGAEATADLLA